MGPRDKPWGDDEGDRKPSGDLRHAQLGPLAVALLAQLPRRQEIAQVLGLVERPDFRETLARQALGRALGPGDPVVLGLVPRTRRPLIKTTNEGRRNRQGCEIIFNPAGASKILTRWVRWIAAQPRDGSGRAPAVGAPRVGNLDNGIAPTHPCRAR